MTRTFVIAASIAIAAAGLSACGDNAAEAPAEEQALAFTADNARLVMPAVEGNPAAVYFDLTLGGEKNYTIRRADVEGAERAEVHEFSEWDGEMVMGESAPMNMTPGETVNFEPGARHVMAFNLAPGLQPGGTAEVTLTVLGGDKFSFPAEIQAAGEDR